MGAEWNTSLVYSGVDTGTANAYAVAYTAMATLVAGSVVGFSAANANTGASTLAVNGGAAIAIKKNGSTALASGDISSGQIIEVVYDGTNFQLIGGSGSSSPLTTKGDLFGHSTVDARIPIGSDGQILTADSTQATGVKWGAAGVGGGGSVLLEAHTASSSAELDFTACLTSTYDVYLIEIVNLLPATNNVDLQLEVSTNGGSSYDTTSGHYSWQAWRWLNSSSGSTGSASDSKISITGALAVASSSATLNGVAGSLKLYNPLSSTGYKRFVGQVQYDATSVSTDAGIDIGGSYRQTTAVNAFRIKASSGNLASGTVRVYGVAH